MSKQSSTIPAETLPGHSARTRGRGKDKNRSSEREVKVTHQTSEESVSTPEFGDELWDLYNAERKKYRKQMAG